MLTTPATKEDVGEHEGELTMEASTGVSKSGSGSELFGSRPGRRPVCGEGCLPWMSKLGDGELGSVKRLDRCKAATVIGNQRP